MVEICPTFPLTKTGPTRSAPMARALSAIAKKKRGIPALAEMPLDDATKLRRRVLMSGSYGVMVTPAQALTPGTVVKPQPGRAWFPSP